MINPDRTAPESPAGKLFWTVPTLNVAQTEAGARKGPETNEANNLGANPNSNGQGS